MKSNRSYALAAVCAVWMFTAPAEGLAQSSATGAPSAQVTPEQARQKTEEAEDFIDAVRSLDIVTVRGFIARGADVNAKGKYVTPLAMISGIDVKDEDVPRHLGIFNLLIENGADVFSADGIEKSTALHRAASAGNCHLIAPLLKMGVPVDIADKDNMTPLASNTRRSFENLSKEKEQRIEKCAAELIENGASPVSVSRHGGTIIGSAVANNRADIVRLLLAKGVKTDGRSDKGWTLLMTAAANLRADMVKMLLDLGADIDAKNSDGDTALMLSVSVDKTNRRLLNNGSPADIAGILIAAGAAVNVENNKGYTALMHALARGYKDAALLLLAHKADPNIKLERGLTPLILSLSDAELVQKLLDHGAIPDAGADQPLHEKPLWKAISSNHFDTVRLFLSLGLDKNPDGTRNAEYAVLSARNNPEMLNIFLDSGTHPNTANKNGVTLLMMAAAGDSRYSAPMVSLLLDRGASIDHQDRNGNSALMVAAQSHRRDIVRLLLERGADTSLRGRENKTALDLVRTELEWKERSQTAGYSSEKWTIEALRETAALLDGTTPVNRGAATSKKEQTYVPHDLIEKATKGGAQQRSALGRLYFYGLEYVPQSDDEAYYWLSICDAELGDAAGAIQKNFHRNALVLEDRAFSGEKHSDAVYYGLLIDPAAKEMCRVLLKTLSTRMTDAQRAKIQPRIDAWFAARPLPKPDARKDEAILRAARLVRGADARIYDIEGIAAMIAAGADLHLNGAQIIASAQKRGREDIAHLVADAMEGKKPAEMLKNIPTPQKSVETHTKELEKADERAAGNALIAKSLRAEADLRHGTPEIRSRAIGTIISDPAGHLPSTLKTLSEALFAKFRDNEAIFWHQAADLRARQARAICPDIRPEFSLGQSDVPLFEYYRHMQPETFAELLQKAVEWDRQTPHEYDAAFGRRTRDCAEPAQIAVIRERVQKDFLRENQPDAHIPPNMREMPSIEDLLVKADAGDAQAQYMLHHCYSGMMCRMAHEDVQRAYDARAEQERQQDHQSTKTYDGSKEKDDYAEKSFYWLSKAAAQNHPHARTSLAQLFMKGSAAQPKDFKKACDIMLQMQAEGSDQIYFLAATAPWNPRSTSYNTELTAWYAVAHAASGEKKPYDWSRYQVRPTDIEEAQRRAAEYTDLYLRQKKPICSH